MSRGVVAYNGKFPVTVAVIDGPSGDREPRHADVVRTVIRSTACGQQAPCRVTVTHYDAFDDASAGPHHLSELAAEINRAVVENQESTRLIINLSLGWFHGQAMNGQPAVRPVLMALAKARCRGALIISAAGNAVNGISGRVPFYPGGFQNTPYNGEAPFCYAVSPDTTDGALFASAHGLSPIWALGFADDRQGRTWMGSSIATAVASGAAASVWSQFPTKTADEVMQALFKGGTPTGVGPVAGPAGWLANQRPVHVNVAGALRAAAGAVASPMPFGSVAVPPLSSSATPMVTSTSPKTVLTGVTAAHMTLKPQPDVIRCRACTCRPGDDAKFDADLEAPPSGDWKRAEVVLKYSNASTKTKVFERSGPSAPLLDGTPVTQPQICTEDAENPIVSGYIEVWSGAEFDAQKPGVRNEIVVTRSP